MQTKDWRSYVSWRVAELKDALSWADGRSLIYVYDYFYTPKDEAFKPASIEQLEALRGNEDVVDHELDAVLALARAGKQAMVAKSPLRYCFATAVDAEDRQRHLDNVERLKKLLQDFEREW